MTRIFITLLAAMLCGLPARAADRLTDRDVKSLVERIDQDRGHFQDELDDSFKHSVIRSPTGEVDVKRTLDDFEKAIEELKDRIKPEYSASTEAATVLRRATALDATMRAQAPAKGVSEWNRLGDDLKSLARVYGTEFPLPDGAAVRRIGDRELAQAAEKLVKTGEQLRKALETDLKKDKSVDEATRKSLSGQVQDWTKAAQVLADRVKDAQPSSAEADKVLQGAGALKSMLESRNASGAKTVLGGAAATLQTVAQAYGRPPAP